MNAENRTPNQTKVAGTRRVPFARLAPPLPPLAHVSASLPLRAFAFKSIAVGHIIGWPALHYRVEMESARPDTGGTQN